MTGKEINGVTPKPLSLSAAEESEFANFLGEVSQAGYGNTRREVKLLVVLLLTKEREAKQLYHMFGLL